MTIAINSTVTAIVPAAYGGNAPVIDLGQGSALISTAVALAKAGSVVLSLDSASRGVVTYTATGLLHELSVSAPSASTQPEWSGQVGSAASVVSALSGSEQAGDGIYNGSGAFTAFISSPTVSVSTAYGSDSS